MQKQRGMVKVYCLYDKDSKIAQSYKNFAKELINYERKEKTTGRNTNIEKYTDKKIIDIVVCNTKITPNDEIYVYLGTYEYSDEIDIIHGSNDVPVSRSNYNVDYVFYQNLEAKNHETIQIPYTKADEFESTHKIIVPQNVVSRQRHFYDLQSEYFETMIFESPEKTKEKVNRLIKR